MDNTTRRRRTKSGEAAPPPTSPQDNGKKRYNLRSRKNIKSDVRWVDDDTLKIDEDADDSTYYPSEEEEEPPSKRPRLSDESRSIHGITLPKDIPVTVKIHIHSHEESEDEDEDSEYDDEEDEEDEDEDDDDDEEEELTEDEIAILLARSLGYNMGKRDRQKLLILNDDGHSPRRKQKDEKPPIYLSKKEREYFEDLPKAKSKKVYLL